MIFSRSHVLAFLLSVFQARAVAGDDALDQVCHCKAEKATPTYNTVTFTVVATVHPFIERWEQLLDNICPTPWPADTYPVPEKIHGHVEDDTEHRKYAGYHGSGDWAGSGFDGHHGSRESGCKVQYLDKFWGPHGHGDDIHGLHGFHPPHWITWSPSSTPNVHPPVPASTNAVKTGGNRSFGDSSIIVQTSTQDNFPDGVTTVTSTTVVPPNPPPPAPSEITTTSTGTLSSTTTSTTTIVSDGTTIISVNTITSASTIVSTSTLTPSSTVPSSSTTTSASSPTETCENIGNGSFQNDNLDPWFISEEVTADSQVVEQGPPGVDQSFALIPSQVQYAQVYLNQYIPRCSDPPPRVDLQVSFQYQFTGNSEGCSIAANVNRDPQDLFTIEDDGLSPGVWQQYQGPVTSVQLTYDSLFTIKLICEEDTGNQEAILITQISVY